MSAVAIKAYVEYRQDYYWVKGTRISLDSVVYAFRAGLSPESIVQCYQADADLNQAIGVVDSLN